MTDIVFDYDLLPCGVLVTDLSCKIIYSNQKLASYINLTVEEIIKHNVDSLLTAASKILFQQILLPTILYEGTVEEIQINFLNSNKKKLPMVIFAHRDNKNSANIVWCCFPALERNKLLNEFNESKKRLEETNSQLKKLSKTDSLTGCYNRREMLLRLKLIRRQATRRQFSFGILMLDLDYFKAVNDNHGHVEGDYVLKQFAQLLMDDARFDDVVARYGGEEFIVLLPDINADGVMKATERIHENMKKIRTKAVSITVSIGVCIAPHHVEATDNELIDLADNALYESKKSGRNKTTLHSIPY